MKNANAFVVDDDRETVIKSKRSHIATTFVHIMYMGFDVVFAFEFVAKLQLGADCLPDGISSMQGRT